MTGGGGASASRSAAGPAAAGDRTPRDRARRGLRSVDRILTTVEDALLLVAAVGLAITMVLIAYSAVARYLFSSPVAGSIVWVAEFLAPAITFFALAATFRIRRHIGVTFVVRKLPGTVRLITQCLAALVTAGVFGLVGYEGALRTVAAAESGQQSSVGAPLFLAYAVVPLGAFLLAVRAVHMCLSWLAGDRSEVSLSEIYENRTTA